MLYGIGRNALKVRPSQAAQQLLIVKSPAHQETLGLLAVTLRSLQRFFDTDRGVIRFGHLPGSPTTCGESQLCLLPVN